MIAIEVLGDTFPLRLFLKGRSYYWNEQTKTWHKIVAECELNNELSKIRPDVNGIELGVILKSVNINGKQIMDGECHLKIKPRGASERGADFLGVYQQEINKVCSVKVITPEKSDNPNPSQETFTPPPNTPLGNNTKRASTIIEALNKDKKEKSDDTFY